MARIATPVEAKRRYLLFLVRIEWGAFSFAVSTTLDGSIVVVA